MARKEGPFKCSGAQSGWWLISVTPLFFYPTHLCIAPPMDSLSPIALLSFLPIPIPSFLFFISPFPPFLPSTTAAAADIPMNCGKVRVQGLQRIILIYAATPVAERASVPSAAGPCRGCAPVLRLPSGRAVAALCTAGEMGCRCTCRFSSFTGRRCMIYL